MYRLQNDCSVSCNLLKWTDTFLSRNMKEIRDMLAPFGGKVVWLRSKRDVQKIIRAQSDPVH